MVTLQKILATCLILFIASGCSDKDKREGRSQALIQVDNNVLTLAEFNEFFEPLRAGYEDPQANSETALREARLRFLLELVEEMTLLRRAEELDLHVADEELEEALAHVEQGYSEGSFKEMLIKQALSLETWKERLRRHLVVQKVIQKELLPNITVTSEEIKDYYRRYGEEWAHGERIHARHILLSNAEEADRVLKRLENGEDFATAARLYSTAPEAKEGGDIGYVARGHLPTCLEAPLFALKDGELSRIIKTPYGYHIFKVIDRKEASDQISDEAIEKIRIRVREEKLEKAYGPWLANLQSRYRIAVNKEMIQ